MFFLVTQQKFSRFSPSFSHIENCTLMKFLHLSINSCPLSMLFYVFQMINLLIVALCCTFCSGATNNNQINIETLIDHGRWLWLALVFLFVFREPLDPSSLSAVLLSFIALVLVLMVPDGVGTQVSVPLTCGNAYQDQSVFWKKDGNEAVFTNKIMPTAMP